MRNDRLTVRPARRADMKWITPAAGRFGLDLDDTGRGRFYVAEVGGAAAGFARMRRWDGFCDLGCVGVLEEFRGRSVAKALVRRLVEICPARMVWITTDIPSFFENLGFREVAPGEAPREIAGQAGPARPSRARAKAAVMFIKKPAS